MTSCWKSLGSLLSECVPSVVMESANSVAPDIPPSHPDTALYQQYPSNTTAVSLFHQPVCTSTNGGGGSSCTTTTRYQSYSSHSSGSFGGTSSFVIAAPQQLLDERTSPLLLPSPSHASCSSSALSPAASRRRTNSCSCSAISRAKHPRNSFKATEVSANNNSFTKSGGSKEERNSATSNSSDCDRQRGEESSRCSRAARRRSLSLSSGTIGVGGRGGGATSRYLLIRPVTDTHTHTIGKAPSLSLVREVIGGRCNYASPSSGDAYFHRQLTPNFELWVEIFCVRRYFLIPKSCLYVRTPRPEFYSSNKWYTNGKVLTSTTAWRPKNLI